MNFTTHAHPDTGDFEIRRVDGDKWLKIGQFMFMLRTDDYPGCRVDPTLADRIIEAIEPFTAMPEVSA